MKLTKNNTKSKLSNKFILHVISVIIISTLIFSIILSYEQYQTKISEIKKDIKNTLKSNKSIIAQALWRIDTKALKIKAHEFLVDNDIKFVKITDENGKNIITLGNDKDIDIKNTIDLYYNHNGKKFFLGKIILGSSTESVIKKIKSSIILLVFQALLLIIIMIIYITYIFNNLISKHLVKIRNYLNNIDITKKQPPLVLDRPKNKSPDELDDTVKAINFMREEAHKNYQKVEYQTLHDSLTNLLNRKAIEKHINELLTNEKSKQHYHALFLINIDHFKFINDSLGHEVGDAILKNMAKRLLTLQTNEKDIGRLGGDVFMFILENIGDDIEKAKQNALNYAQKILKTIQKPFKIKNMNYHISASIGIKIFGKESSVETIIKNADNALYHAKLKGPNQIELFYPKMQISTDRRLRIEEVLRIAIKNHSLIVHFQPKCGLDGTVYSAEALVRMKSDNGEFFSPAEFIPIAEEAGLIIDLGKEIMKKVFKFIHDYEEIIKQSTLKNIAINISPTHFTTERFCEEITHYAKKFNIADNFITIEITEEATITDIHKLIDVMNCLKENGFNLSIDDFGTGYSSFQYLQKFPLDELKIDKSFIDEIPTSPQARDIVKTIITMAHNLNFHVVAEGVEYPEQLEFLKKYKCDLIQGYIFYKPLSKEEFLKVLKNTKK
ncbi:two-component system, chemotaxis family, CheB/CheR fusion protein [Lebetimonas natsushimae]|uniref:Two-component system, chemotaxis family, CheB/CheR fusion protein n=1 Tax=Lebetimonas natsushimae TaxID=1936991 RepID=A0A292YDX8_9BACT|nr:GGDEF domain-containing phosphodiesterase [Lebetimonas natsushimae]GAX87549.1 two-component system, chemotaxis family, CheB/CheR fusion protein [Lebetimonas natsushimae]